MWGAGGYFGAAGDDPSILMRAKEDYDGAEPAASSIAAPNLFKLAALFSGEAGQRWFAAFGLCCVALCCAVMCCAVLCRAVLS